MSRLEGSRLANFIVDAFEEAYKTRLFKSHRSIRTDVTSEKLCDDVIQYLGSSLEPYKGCTIIDINPGACLWSAKLHDYLKPKCHLLMEPEPAYYEPFIEPLIRQSGSTYRYTPLHGIHSKSYWSNYDRIFSDPKLLPPRPSLASGDSALREIDTSMLVIGNMKRSYGLKSKGGNVSVVTLLLQHMAYAALSNEMFHRNGLVRMLWWLEEDAKFSTLGYESIFSRRPFTIGLDLASRIHQVAGTKSLIHTTQSRVKHIVRPQAIHHQVQARVRETMQNEGITAPEGRELLQLDYPDLQNQIDELNPLQTDCKTFAELAEVVDEFNDYIPSVGKILNEVYAGRSKHEKFPNPEQDLSRLKYRKCIDICREPSKSLPPKTREQKPASALDLLLRMINIEATYCVLAEQYPDDPKKDDLYQKILDASKACNEVLDTAPQQAVDIARPIALHLLSYYASVLDYDKRRYDPFQIEPDDFFPATKMSLLDMTPRNVDFAIDGITSTAEGARIAQAVIKMLFMYPSQPLPRALDHLAINAGKDVVKMVPAITDPRRGGRLDPMNVLVRMLSTDVLIELITAFIKWPFRPETWRLDVTAHSEAAHQKDLADMA